MNSVALTYEQVQAEQQRFITKVYWWMGWALVVTAGVAWLTISTPAMIQFILGRQIIFFGLIIGELILVGVLAGAINRMSATTAMLVFFGYSAINGLTLSVIFFIYTAESLASTFLITAATFGAMSFYGYVTKRDLTGFGSFLFMGLIGIIIASLANFFFKSSALYWLTTYIGIFIFIGLTAYDTQKIKRMGVLGNEGSEGAGKEAIRGALMLYLDFINLFLLLLRLFGRRK